MTFSSRVGVGFGECVVSEKNSSAETRKFGALWSLEFGVGVFHEYLLINFGWGELLQRRILTSPQVG